MDKRITVVIHGQVVPKQSVRVQAIPYWDEKKNKCAAFIKTYQTKKITDYENLVRQSALEQLGFDNEPFDGALEAEVLIVEPIPKSMTKKDLEFIASGGVIYKITSPDLTDNLVKGIFDPLHKIAFNNDGQICKTSYTKIYGFEPRAVVVLTQIDQKYNLNSLI